MLKIKVPEEEVELAYLGTPPAVLSDLCIAVVALIKDFSEGDPELADIYLTAVIRALMESASAILDDTLQRTES